MMALVTASGLMLSAQLKPIAVSYGYDKIALFGGFTVLTLTLSLNQVLNGSARPFFGWVSDRIGRYDTMAIVFVLEAITIIVLTLVVARPFWFIAISAAMFFAWGDIYSLFPAAIADIFGSKHATTNYGIQYTAKGVGSILAGPGAAFLMASTGSWIPVFWAAVTCNVIAAALAVLWLKSRVARLIKEQTSQPPPPISKAVMPASSEALEASRD
jgi:MFS family permease